MNSNSLPNHFESNLTDHLSSNPLSTISSNPLSIISLRTYSRPLQTPKLHHTKRLRCPAMLQMSQYQSKPRPELPGRAEQQGLPEGMLGRREHLCTGLLQRWAFLVVFNFPVRLSHWTMSNRHDLFEPVKLLI